MTDFFEYHCDACDAPYCERVHIMNLTLGNVDEEYCLKCLGAEYDQPEAVMATTCYGYVAARDCFKDPWEKFDASSCPNRSRQTCYCQPPSQTTVKETA